MSITQKHTFILLLQLAVPMAITGLLESTVFFFENLFLAKLGKEALAAGALVGWLFGTFDAILFGILTSINVLIAHKSGSKDKTGINNVVRDGLRLAIILALPSCILFWNMSSLFLLFGQSPHIVHLAKDYLHALTWGILPNFILIALLEVIIGLGYARLVLISSIISVTLTIFFSYVLIFGKLGFASVGIAGAGWGISISGWFSLLFLGFFIWRDQKYSKYFKHFYSTVKNLHLIELLKIGVPMGIMYSVEVAFFFVLTLLMGSLGENFLAANQIALQYMSTFMAIIFSIAQAVTVRIGHAVGARNIEEAKAIAYSGMTMSTVLTLLAGFIYIFFPTHLIQLDFDLANPKYSEIIQHATEFLRICALFQFLEGIRITLFGALRGLKDTHFTLLISVFSFWGISFPLGYFFITRGENGSSVWWAMCIGAFCSVLFLIFRFKNQLSYYKFNKTQQ